MSGPLPGASRPPWLFDSQIGRSTTGRRCATPGWRGRPFTWNQTRPGWRRSWPAPLATTTSPPSTRTVAPRRTGLLVLRVRLLHRPGPPRGTPHGLEGGLLRRRACAQDRTVPLAHQAQPGPLRELLRLRRERRLHASPPVLPVASWTFPTTLVGGGLAEASARGS